eukprot:scaffold250_cov110-Isochrysis_galbana.AAC.23
MEVKNCGCDIIAPSPFVVDHWGPSRRHAVARAHASHGLRARAPRSYAYALDTRAGLTASIVLLVVACGDVCPPPSSTQHLSVRLRRPEEARARRHADLQVLGWHVLLLGVRPHGSAHDLPPRGRLRRLGLGAHDLAANLSEHRLRPRGRVNLKSSLLRHVCDERQLVLPRREDHLCDVGRAAPWRIVVACRSVHRGERDEDELDLAHGGIDRGADKLDAPLRVSRRHLRPNLDALAGGLHNPALPLGLLLRRRLCLDADRLHSGGEQTALGRADGGGGRGAPHHGAQPRGHVQILDHGRLDQRAVPAHLWRRPARRPRLHQPISIISSASAAAAEDEAGFGAVEGRGGHKLVAVVPKTPVPFAEDEARLDARKRAAIKARIAGEKVEWRWQRQVRRRGCGRHVG